MVCDLVWWKYFSSVRTFHCIDIQVICVKKACLYWNVICVGTFHPAKYKFSIFTMTVLQNSLSSETRGMYKMYTGLSHLWKGKVECNQAMIQQSTYGQVDIRLKLEMFSPWVLGILLSPKSSLKPRRKWYKVLWLKSCLSIGREMETEGSLPILLCH